MPLRGAAVVLGDDDVLRHVDELAGEVAGVRGLQRGIGETLTGAVRGDEVLEHGQAFAEVRGDRALDDFAGGLGHEAAHAGELLDLLAVTARAGVHHEVDRVQLLAALVVLEGAEHDVRDLVTGVGPDVDDLVVALAVGDDALGDTASRLRRSACRRSSSSICFSFGMIMSSMPIEIPACIAQWKPSSFSLSSVSTVAWWPGDLVGAEDDVARSASSAQALLKKPTPCGPDLVEDHAADRGLDDVLRRCRRRRSPCRSPDS